MSRFGSDPHAFFDSVYQETPPWDIGGPQPALSALFTAYPPASPVLDVGCGSGDLVIALAQAGLEVVGVDFVAAAIEQARAKVAALPPEVARRVEFQVADALQPSRLQRQFGAIVDCGFFHLFDAGQRDRLAGEVALALRPGGRYYLHEFATEFPVPNTPLKVTEEELRACFTEDRGWRILEIRAAEFQSRIAPVPAICACIERLP